MDKVAADDTPLSHVDEGELQAEVERRVVMRKEAGRAPAENPRARSAGASKAALSQRQKAAKQRAAEVGAARDKRERAERLAGEKAFRDAQARASRQRSRPRPGPSSGPKKKRRTRPRSPFGRKNDKIARYYRVLNLPYGADFAEVKKAFRKLVRKYHPDKHVKSPQKQKAATELTMRVTQAYNELEEHLTGDKRK